MSCYACSTPKVVTDSKVLIEKLPDEAVAPCQSLRQPIKTNRDLVDQYQAYRAGYEKTCGRIDFIRQWQKEKGED